MQRFQCIGAHMTFSQIKNFYYLSPNTTTVTSRVPSSENIFKIESLRYYCEICIWIMKRIFFRWFFFWFLSSSSRTQVTTVWSFGDDGATNHHCQHCHVENLECHFCDQISTPFNIRLHGLPRYKKNIHRQFHFQHSDLFEQIPSPRHQSLMSLYDRFSGARAACDKRIGSMKPIWTSSFGQGPHLTWKSHFQQQVVWGTRLVLLEQSSFIKFKSCPHLWIVEKRAYSAPELCVYKLPSALPLKL